MAADEGIGHIDVPDLYKLYKLATLTGWTIEYINSLGFLTEEAFLQIYDAEQAIPQAKRQTQANRRKAKK